MTRSLAHRRLVPSRSHLREMTVTHAQALFAFLVLSRAPPRRLSAEAHRQLRRAILTWSAGELPDVIATEAGRDARESS
jgi:hypothetical protein